MLRRVPSSQAMLLIMKEFHSTKIYARQIQCLFAFHQTRKFVDLGRSQNRMPRRDAVCRVLERAISLPLTTESRPSAALISSRESQQTTSHEANVDCTTLRRVVQRIFLLSAARGFVPVKQEKFLF